MAFDVKIEKKSRGPHGAGGVDVRLSKSLKNGSLGVNIAGEIAAAVGIRRGDYVSILSGTGEDVGSFAIVPGGEFKVSPQGDSKRLRVSCSSLLPHLKSLSSTTCKHSVVGNMLIVEIPERLRSPALAHAA